MVTATKSQRGWNDRNSQRKNGHCPSRILLESLLKRFLKVQSSTVLISFQNGDNKTTLKDLEKQLRVLLRSNLTYVPHILKGETEKQTDMAASIKH